MSAYCRLRMVSEAQGLEELSRGGYLKILLSCDSSGSIPEYNRLAIRFADLSGWKQFGFNEKSHMKNGKLWGQILFGISKDELKWDS